MPVSAGPKSNGIGISGRRLGQQQSMIDTTYECRAWQRNDLQQQYREYYPAHPIPSCGMLTLVNNWMVSLISCWRRWMCCSMLYVCWWPMTMVFRFDSMDSNFRSRNSKSAPYFSAKKCRARPAKWIDTVCTILTTNCFFHPQEALERNSFGSHHCSVIRFSHPCILEARLPVSLHQHQHNK